MMLHLGQGKKPTGHLALKKTSQDESINDREGAGSQMGEGGEDMVNLGGVGGATMDAAEKRKLLADLKNELKPYIVSLTEYQLSKANQ